MPKSNSICPCVVFESVHTKLVFAHCFRVYYLVLRGLDGRGIGARRGPANQMFQYICFSTNADLEFAYQIRVVCKRTCGVRKVDPQRRKMRTYACNSTELDSKLNSNWSNIDSRDIQDGVVYTSYLDYWTRVRIRLANSQQMISMHFNAIQF